MGINCRYSKKSKDNIKTKEMDLDFMDGVKKSVKNVKSTERKKSQ